MDDKFNIKFPIDWDRWFIATETKTDEGCTDSCECDGSCLEDDLDEVRLRLADAVIELSESNKLLAELIDRIYGELS